jgi:hypothetical protein
MSVRRRWCYADSGCGAGMCFGLDRLTERLHIGAPFDGSFGWSVQRRITFIPHS